MYNQWLEVFFSQETDIPVKGKNEKQKIIKEWMGNNMKISGTKPSKWSVILQPELEMDMRKYIYDIDREKDRRMEDMRKAFYVRDENMFDKAEKSYDRENKEKKVVEDILNGFKIKKMEMAERLFQAKRNLFLLNHQRKIKKLSKEDIKQLTAINNEIKEIIHEQLNQNNEIQFKKTFYTPNTSTLKSEGPVPEPPDIKPLTFSKISKIQKTIKETKKKVIEEINSDLEDLSDEEMSGGVKIIKLR